MSNGPEPRVRYGGLFELVSVRQGLWRNNEKGASISLYVPIAVWTLPSTCIEIVYEPPTRKALAMESGNPGARDRRTPAPRT